MEVMPKQKTERLVFLKKSQKNPDGSMPFIGHIRELRKLLIISIAAVVAASIAAFIFYQFILSILFKPFEMVYGGSEGDVLFVNTLLEGFLTKIKIALLTGVLLSSPIHVYNIVHFLFPGLTQKEKKVVGVALLTSFVLIVASAYYGYFKVIPISLQFLTNSGFIPEKVGMLLNFGKNVFYIFNFILGTIVLFQFPIIVEILLVMNVLKRRSLIRSSRYIVVGIFLVAALLTPPDFISQVSLALPMIVLYFLTILVAKIFKFGEE